MSWRYLAALIILASVVRLLWLDRLPPSIVYDELNYVLNAKSLYLTGQNIPWTASALFSWGEKNFDIVISEVPSVVNALWVGPNELNLFNARFPNALLSILSVALVYLITRLLLNELTARIAGIFMAVSPWNIHLGRTALELSPAVFFFLLGTYLLLKYSGLKIFYSLPIFILGFLSYLGAKLVFLPIIIILLIYKYSTTKKQNKRLYFIYFAIGFLVFLSYSLTLKYQPAGERQSELLVFNPTWSQSIVNDERRQEIPNPLLNFFSNKPVALVKRVIDNYLAAFSTTPLFTKGETISIYSTWEYGQLHFLDFGLIIVGLLALFRYYRRVFYLMVALIAASPLASSVDLVQQTYAVRSFYMFPFLIITSAAGFWWIWAKLKHGRVIAILIGVGYLLSALYFLHLYYFRFPIYSAERWRFSERVASSYARLAQNDPGINKVYVVAEHSEKWAFEEYLFYSGAYNSSQDVKRINQKMKVRDFSEGRVSYLNKCPDKLGLKDVLVIDRRVDCGEKEVGNHGIVDLKDAGTVMIIQNDLLCQDVPNLARYSRVHDLGQLKVEEQSKDTFCQNWISKL